MQIYATPLALSNSPASREIRRMARSLNGDHAAPEKKNSACLDDRIQDGRQFLDGR
jgi:hypothetical protein